MKKYYISQSVHHFVYSDINLFSTIFGHSRLFSPTKGLLSVVYYRQNNSAIHYFLHKVSEIA